ncbi:MAG TPA: type I restriction endonuclease subunit R [Ktedonobacterales bacterium]|nr:type I restriction endonuclease subunit R [Ktedonobacterales bacterium]
MVHLNEYSEDALVEQPAIALFAALGYQTANCYYETFGPHGSLGRETSSEVVLRPRLRAALERLNPGLPHEAISQAIEELTRDRSMLSPVHANREIYKLLKDGVHVFVRNQADEQIDETVRVIDWNAPGNNDFFLASQFWITGEMYKRRADLIGFINGLPLVFVELKASHRRLEHAYNDNLSDYRDTIPQLFWYNALIILSNGSQSKVGSMTAGWEHFFDWKKINSEGEEGIVSLETIIQGTCEPGRLLDLIENFTLFSDAGGTTVKLIAKNHQFLGVNTALAAVRGIRQNQGRLGVFWHTQGSGKSFSMVFFAQKVLRKVPGNWTFLIVTDRDDLDKQIYKTFAGVGAVTEPEPDVHATSGAHLQELLRADHRTVFTLIQKFHTEKGATYPKLSDRHDIIVMTDEAHRSQYDTLALNMRNALPHAAFIGFTGTPLMAGEEKTREVFGDYLSIYNFRQSVEDGTTVPLYYENRIPELQLTNANFDEEMERVIEEAELDEAQEKRLEREFAREYHLITRDDRLEKIAEDIVAHFMGRGQMGKAMVVSIDKATAVRMYDKVQAHWRQELDRLRLRLRVSGEDERKQLVAMIAFMQETDIAVVVSQSQNEIAEFQKKGLEIVAHRKRIVTENLDKKFKDADDPLRIVFVCAMWMTGFDVPSLSTIYLDKPMRNHTLMQTIARANRVFADKVNGLIVDYIGVFRDLQKALAIYGSAQGGGVKEGEAPVKDKSELIEKLKQAIAETTAFCESQGIKSTEVMAAQGLMKLRLLDDARDALLINDETKKKYLLLAATVKRLYRAILPDPTANTFTALVALFIVLAERIQALAPETNISQVTGQIEQLLDSSIATTGYVIRESGASYDTDDHWVDLSQIDFDALRAKFEHAHKHTVTEQLRGALSSKLKKMVQRNKSRKSYAEKFQHLIEEYNTGNINVEIFFDKLVELAKELDGEEQRTIAERLSEEELAIFDLLTRPDMTLSDSEKEQIKNVAREMLATLKREKLVLDWRKKQQTRAQVRLVIEDMLDNALPPSYTRQVYEEKCDEVYQHIYESYFGQGASIYTLAS